MNGYFERLIARSTGSGSEVRPLSRQPHAALPEEKPLAGGDEFLVDGLRFRDRAPGIHAPGQNNPSAAEATETANTADTANISVPTLRVDAPTVTGVFRALDTIPVVKTTVRDSGAMSLRQSATGSERPRVMNEDNASTIRGTHSSHPAKTAQPIDPVITQPTGQETRVPVEEFRLMPLQPRPVARDAAPSTVSPFSPASPDAHSQRYTSPSPSGQRGNQHAEHAPRTVQVTIGRVEIRATVATAPARKTAARSPAMSLDEYLKQRNGSR